VTEKLDTLVLGCGNDLRGDDALGPIVVDELQAMLPDEPHVRFEVRCGLTPELADTLATIDRLVFVDCSLGGPHGVVRRVEYGPSDDADIACVHLLDLPALLSWTKQLYGRAPRAVAYTIAGESFELSEELSPNVADALPELIDKVCRELGVLHHA